MAFSNPRLILKSHSTSLKSSPDVLHLNWVIEIASTKFKQEVHLTKSV